MSCGDQSPADYGSGTESDSKRGSTQSLTAGSDNNMGASNPQKNCVAHT